MNILPFSNKRYIVNRDHVLTSTGEKLLPDKSGNVRITWLDGDSEHKLDLLYLISRCSLTLDPSLWTKLIIVYLDGDRENWEITNMAYCFKEPLEVEGLEGFYHVPNCGRYAIRKDGLLLDLKTMQTKVWYISKPGRKNSTGGYYLTSLVNDLGKRKHYTRHRLLVSTFKGFFDGVGKLVINHLNGIPGSDDLDNIVWSTYSENNLHAYELELRPRAQKPILMKNLKTGEVTRFNRVVECARILGYDSGTFIYWRMKYNPTRVYSDYLHFKDDDGSEWPIPDYSKIWPTVKHRKCYARNIFTGEIILANTAKALEVLTGVSKDIIGRHLSKNHCNPSAGFNFREEDENGEISWPYFTEEVLGILKRNGCKVITFIRVDDGQSVRSMDILEVAELLGVNRHRVHNILNCGGTYKHYTLQPINKVPLERELH